MLRVGLTGGLATGKTYVGECLRSLGCHLLQADKIGHQLLRRGQAAYAPVLAAFGASILNEDREIDRTRLAAIVFADPPALQKLNAIIHPLVFAYEDSWMDEIAARDPHAIAVVEAAILVETGNYKSFDYLLVTWCPEPLQVERALSRGGATEEEIRRRLARQMPADEKKKYADFVIDTSGTLAETEAQTRNVFQKLVTLENEGPQK